MTVEAPTPVSCWLSDKALLSYFVELRIPDAFAKIVRAYAPAVFTTALRILGDSALAQDAVQETFFRLMKHAGEVSESLGGWLHRAVTRLAVDTLRSEKCRKRRELYYTSS